MRWSTVKRIVQGVRCEIEDDHIPLVSAGVAFFAFLALFPAFAALVAIYGLVFDPTQVEQQMAAFDAVLPADAHSLIAAELERLVQAAPSSLSIGVVVGFAIALWSATKGTRGVIEAINLAYDTSESRGFIGRNVFALALTLGMIVFFVLTVALTAGVPVALAWVGLGGAAEASVEFARWPLLVAVVLVGVSAFYRFVPAKKRSPRRFVTVGSVFATMALLASSAGFSLYVSRFGDYNRVYGSLGAVAIFLLWLYIASFVVLLGAEIDAEIDGRSESAPRAMPPAQAIAAHH